MNFYTSQEGSNNIVFHAPHGGLVIPPGERELFLFDDKGLEEEHLNMVDWYTNDMVHKLHQSTGSNFFLNHLSRLVCDPERFIGEGEEMESVGMGFAYTHGHQRQKIRDLSDFDKERILKSYYEPYAASFTNLVDDVLAREGSAFILDIHSYATKALPYELHGDGERPEICIGFDPFHAKKEHIDAIATVLGEHYSVSCNSPFAGSYVPLKHYGKTPEVSSIMLEIRRDVYMQEHVGLKDTPKYSLLVERLEKACNMLNRVLG